MFIKDKMFPRFALYGFLKNLRFFDPFIILIFRDAGLSFLQIGMLYAIRDVATNILEIPTGVFADAFGRRRSMLMALAAYIISFITFFAFTNFYLYSLAMVLFAFGEAFRTGTHKALILEYLLINNMEHLKVEYYGRTRSISQIGSAINALIAGALVFFTGNYRAMFLAATIPYVLDFFNLLSYPAELDGELKKLSRKEIKTQIRSTFRVFGQMVTEPKALKAILNSSSFNALFKSTKDYLQPILETFVLAIPILLFMEDKERGAIVIGIVYFVIYLITSYASRSSANFQRLFRSIGHTINITFLIGSALLVIAGIAAWGNYPLLSILVFLLFYALHNVRLPMNISFISDQISHKTMASGLSVESQFTTLLAAIFAPLLGWMADKFGVGLALVALASLVLLLFIIVRVDEEQKTIITT